MIEGCLAWQADGLAPPETVKTATAGYFDTQDTFGEWLQEKCNAEPGNKKKTATSSELFASWSTFAKAAGEEPGTRKRFAKQLEKRGFIPYRREDRSQTRAWYGLYPWPEGHFHSEHE